MGLTRRESIRDSAGECSVDRSAPLAADEARTTVFFFAGQATWGQSKYSNGVRERVFDLLSHEPDFKIGRWGTNADMATSVFCLAPSGLAFGDRLFIVVLYGCIPVIIQDNITQVRASRWRFKAAFASLVVVTPHPIRTRLHPTHGFPALSTRIVSLG